MRSKRQPAARQAVASERATAAVPQMWMFVAAALALAAAIAALLTGAPDENVWTYLLEGLSIGAAGWAILRRATLAGSDSAPAQRLALRSLLALAAFLTLSLLLRWLGINHGGPAYIDIMLRGLVYWAALAAAAFLAWQAARHDRASTYIVVVAVVAAAGIAAGIGVQDYLITVFRNHIANWREFGTSFSPDFYAAYLLITIPLTLALFLGAPSGAGRRASWLIAVILLLQLAALPATGSRFALISLVVMLAVFAVGMAGLRRHGFELPRATRVRLISLSVLAALGAATFAGPVLHRLQAGTLSQQANSGAFRIYTWQGAIRLAKHYPLLGAGPAMFQYAYPPYANVGFTRYAHSGYLQLLDEGGALSLLAAAAFFASSLTLAWKGLKSGSAIADTATRTESTLLSQTAPENGDDRLLIVGLFSGLAAFLFQNAVDSDWNIPICGVTLFIAAGLLHGFSARAQQPDSQASSSADQLLPQPLRYSLAAAALLLTAFCVCFAFATVDISKGDFESARMFNPLSSEAQAGPALHGEVNGSAAVADLARAVQLTPSSVAYYRLARVTASLGQSQTALANVQTGLLSDPHSLELLLLGAQLDEQLGNRQAAMGYYSQMAALEAEPYGQVRAIGDTVEYHYAYADAALAAEALRLGDMQSAVTDYRRAQATLEAYAGNSFRRMGIGGNPGIDASLKTLYAEVTTQLAAAYTAIGDTASAAAVHARAQNVLPLFAIHAPAAPRPG